MKKLITVLILALLTVALVSGSAVAQSSKPVVKVNGTVLTEADLEEALNEIMPAGVFHGGFSSEKRKKHRPEALEKMIEKELFFQEALKQGLDVKQKVKEEREKNIERLGGKKKFKASLKKAGVSDKQYQKVLSKKFLIEELIAKEIHEKSVVSDEQALSYYNENKARFKRPESRKVTHILISVDPSSTMKEKAEKLSRAKEVLAKIKSGEEMSMLAWDYSDDPFRVKGGDMGFVHKGRIQPELEEAIFGLEPGRVSEIIESRFGYHIARIESVKPSEQLPFEDVVERLKNQIKEQKEKEFTQSLISRLRAGARIELLLNNQ